ncbi:uncharacterized protein LOC135496866 [Lineus longissimus]|uniref:uncharacterized protein LOC135496866 n=1 Tax=Lineus longissimus TaxID=88925 RepID=UPI00315C6B58
MAPMTSTGSGSKDTTSSPSTMASITSTNSDPMTQTSSTMASVTSSVSTSMASTSTPTAATTVRTTTKVIFYLVGALKNTTRERLLRSLEIYYSTTEGDNVRISLETIDVTGDSGEPLTEVSFTVQLSNGTVLDTKYAQTIIDTATAADQSQLGLPLPVYQGPAKPTPGTSAEQDWWARNWAAIAIGVAIAILLAAVITLDIIRRRHDDTKTAHIDILHRNKAFNKDDFDGVLNNGYHLDKNPDELLAMGFSEETVYQGPGMSISVEDTYETLHEEPNSSVVNMEGFE